MKISQAALTAATPAIFKPVAAQHGFKKLRTRDYARLNDGGLQFLYFQLSAGGSKQFTVWDVSITLYSPREHFVLMPGGRLPSRNGSDAWWSARNHDFANSAMPEVVQIFTSHAVPWFNRTATTRGLMDEMRQNCSTMSRPDAHYLFDIACCQAHLGELDQASASALAASKAYKQLHDEMPGRTWCLDEIEKCAKLEQAIRNSTQDNLLAEWYQYSIRQLKLERILP